VKKLSRLVAISLFALLIVLPVLCSVNPSAGNSVSNKSVLVADGWPVPPLPPGNAETLVADGWPVPPLPPNGAYALAAA
jgi:hypothetical protein